MPVTICACGKGFVHRRNKICPDCIKARKNSNSVRATYMRQMRELKVTRRDAWTCGRCGKRHNTYEDIVCYFCFTPRVTA